MSTSKKFKADNANYMGNDVDLRNEMQTIMRVHGHWGLLRRRIKDRHCSCWDPVNQEARLDCKTCLGSGYAFVDCLIRMRKQSSSALEAPSPAGRISETTARIWVQHKVKPDRGDFIAELAQDPESNLRSFQIQAVVPFSVTKMYDIQDVVEMREFGGRVEFFTILVEEADFGDTA